MGRPSLRVVAPGGGEVVGDAPDRRVEVLCDDDALNATWSRFGPGRDGADLHVHREHRDLFYVLSGELRIRLGPAGDEVPAPAGTLVELPPLVVHGFRNASAGEVTYLNLHAPGRRFADYLRARRDGRPFAYDQWDPPADGGRSAGDARVAAGDGGRVESLAEAAELRVERVALPAAGAAVRPPARGGGVSAYWVLEGACSAAAGGDAQHAPAGAWIEVAAGAAGPAVTAVGGPARLLAVHAPPA